MMFQGKSKVAIVAVVVSAVLIIAGLTVLALRPRNNQQQNNDSNNTTSATNQSSDNFEERARQAELECVARGHQNYRSQQVFAIDPSNTDVMYFGVEFKGLFKSLDGGATWKQSSEGIRGYYKKDSDEKCIQEMGKIIIDPQDPTRLLLSRVDTPGTINDLFSETAGAYLSTDSGATWKQVVKSGMNASGSKAIAFDPQNPQIIYYGSNNAPASWGGADKDKFFNEFGILYKSVDGGTTWKELKTGISKYLRASDILIDKANKSRIFLGAFRPSGDEQDRNLNADQSLSLLLSEDAGTTWQPITSRLPEATAVIDIMQSTKNPLNIFIVGQAIKQEEPSKTFYSTDGGASFKTSPAVSLYAAAFDPHSESRLLSYQPFANKPGIYESTNAGATWSFKSTLPSVIDGNQTRITNITWDPKASQIVYANGDGGHLLKSTDNGATWAVLVSATTLP